MEHWPVHFSMNSPRLHSKAIAKLWQALPKKYRSNLSAHQRRNQSILIDSHATLHICYEALRNYLPIDSYEDQDISPAQDELENIYRAYLKCNSYWTSKQKLFDNINDISLSIEVPFIEFKNHKKILTAGYKSIKFFEFCKKDPNFSLYLSKMLEDLGLENWLEYIDHFISLYKNVIKAPYVIFDDSDASHYNFFLQFAVDIKEIKELGEWDGNASLKYLRDHFLVNFDKNAILVLSPDFVCDKLYQGLKFMMWRSIQKHGLTHPNGNRFESFKVFLGLLGENFSEKHLMNEIIFKSLQNHVDKIYTDDDIKKAKISSPSDFYIIKGDSLILIEYKDSLFPDDSKHSGDLDKIKETIREKICLDQIKNADGSKRVLKGVGQLLDTISRIAKGEYNNFDSSFNNIKYIFPVVVTTDITFSALGVNAYVIQQTSDLIKRHNDALEGSGLFTAVPTIIDIDSLIDM